MSTFGPTIIAISGADRVGKKTQTSMLHEALTRRGHAAKLIEVPWAGSKTHGLIYHMLENGWAFKFPTLFQFVQNINKLSCQRYIKKCCSFYDYIILDRWRLSTIAYGSATGANKSLTKLMYKKMLSPDVTFILSGHKLTLVAEDDYEKDDELQENVRRFYLNSARSYEGNCFVVKIDRKPREAIHEEIVKELLRRELLTIVP